MAPSLTRCTHCYQPFYAGRDGIPDPARPGQLMHWFHHRGTVELIHQRCGQDHLPTEPCPADVPGWDGAGASVEAQRG